MTPPADVQTAVVDAHRHEWALVLAATARVARDLDLAEERVQEAVPRLLAPGGAPSHEEGCPHFSTAPRRWHGPTGV